MLPSLSSARLALLALLLAAACAGALVRAPSAAQAAPACEGACADSVKVTYLGVGGWMIRRGGDAVMTAPFFSTPRLSAVGLGRPIHADTGRASTSACGRWCPTPRPCGRCWWGTRTTTT